MTTYTVRADDFTAHVPGVDCPLDAAALALYVVCLESGGHYPWDSDRVVLLRVGKHRFQAGLGEGRLWVRWHPDTPN